MKRYILTILMTLVAFVSHAQTDIFSLMERRDVSLSEIDVLATEHFKVNGTGKGTGYKQYQRWFYEQQFHLDANGFIRSPQDELDAYQQALGSMGAMGSGFGPSATSGIWSELGPTNWNKTSGWNPGNGRLATMAVQASNQNIIYVGSPGGGMWKTINGGTTWIPLSEYNSVWMYIYSITIDPLNPNIVYAGTGNSGNQVLRSTDAGATWTVLGAGPTGNIRKILIHPTSTNIVFACASNGIFRSVNSGSSWTQVRTGSKEDIEFKPGDPTIMYACGNTEVVRSVDGGISWSVLGSTAGISGTGRSFIAVTPANANYVYVVQASGSVFGALYRSTNSGVSFTTMVTGNATAGTNYFGYDTDGTGTTGQAGHDMALCVSPVNANEVHIAGIICWKSTNGGTSFTATTAWSLPNSIGYNHADVHGLEFVGSNLYSISDGGIYKSINNGDDWTDISAGMGIRQFYRLASSPTNGTVVTAGAQDNGSVAKQASGTWVDWLGADGMEGLVSPTNHLNIWGTSQNGQLYKSTNGGTSRTTIASITGGAWVTPIAMHPSNETILFAGGTAVYKSTNGGTSFTNISGTTITNSLVDIAVAPSNANYIYASHSNNLYVTTNGGTSWTTYTAPGTITDICVSPSNPSKIWITTSGGTGRVHRSINNGATFINISGTLPNIAARSVVVDNSTDEKLYVGMSIGVYTYSNSNPAWMIMTDNLPLVAINELDIQYSTSKLRVATYGRGIWETSLITSGCLAPSGLTTTSVTNTGATLNWLAVAGATNYTVEYKLASSSTWTVLSSSTTTLSFVLSGLSVGTTYDFRVRTNCGSTSSFYAVSQFTTTSPPPACISAFEPNETQATATTIALNTTISAGISTATDIDFYSFTTTTFTNLSIELTNLPFDYDIYVVNSSGTQIGSGTNGGTNDELVTFTALAPGTYAIRVIGYAGVFSTTQCYSLMVGAVIVSPCLVPGGQNTTSITGTSASVNWAAVSGAVGYSVQYRVSGAATWTYAGISTTPTRSLTGLAFNTLYEWQVRTRCASDSSAYSGTFTFTTLPNCPSTVGSTMSNPVIVGQAPCALSPYTNTQTNTLANCFLNNYSGPNNQASPNVWYRFNLVSAATVQVGHCGSIMVDTYIHLLDSSGNHLFSNDDNGPLCSGYRASISASLPAGTYYVVSEGYGTGTGAITTTIATTSPCQTVLNLGVLLQGYYNGSAGMVPAMWNQGHIASPAVTNLDVDHIVVSLRSSAAPYTQVASVTARLKTNGTAVCTFPYLNGNYYIVVSHRNSLETWSAAPVSFASSPVNYQFQTSAAQAFGQNQKQVAPGVFALYTGELEKDGNVDLFDLTDVQNDAVLFMGGYIATDINGDGNVDLLDTPMVEENANNFIFELRP